jgi:hypothetical protein
LLSSERVEEEVMSQPPGPHGGEPDPQAERRRPGPFPQPGVRGPSGPPAPYGPPPSYARPPYGTPGYPYPDPYGPPPKRRNLLPWLVVGGALLIFGLGLLLVLLLTR